MLVSFDKEFRDVSEHIKFHSAEVDWVANAANIAESQKAREIERRVQEVRSSKHPLLSSWLKQTPVRKVAK